MLPKVDYVLITSFFGGKFYISLYNLRLFTGMDSFGSTKKEELKWHK